jgi:hypothetical protein
MKMRIYVRISPYLHTIDLFLIRDIGLAKSTQGNEAS